MNSSEEDAKKRMQFREQLAQDLHCMQLIKPIGFVEFLEFDELILGFGKEIRLFTRSPLRQTMLDRSIDEYLLHHDPLDDYELVYILENLPHIHKEAKRFLSLIAAACGLFFVGAYIGETIAEVIYSEEEEGEGKGQRRTNIAFQHVRWVRIVPLSKAIEIFKRAVSRPDYQIVLRKYAPALEKVLKEDEEALKEFEELVMRLTSHYPKAKEEKALFTTVLILAGAFVLGVVAGFVKSCQEAEEEEEGEER